MEKFVSLTVSGLTLGMIYALVSLGVVVVFRISRIVNLAQGAMGVFSTFVFHYEFNERLHLPIGVSFVLTLLVGAVLGVVIERMLIGPVRRDGILATLIMTVGVLLVLTELTVQFWGPNTPVIDSIFPDTTVRFAGTGVTVHQLGTAAVVVVVGALLYVLLNRTRYGLAVQAIAEDPGAAHIVGLPVRLMTTSTWALGGASAALAGMLFIHLNVLDPISLTFVMISSLVAAVIGGFNSLPLAVGGSIAFGLVYQWSSGYISTSGSADLVVFIGLVAVLLVLRNNTVALESVVEL
ncbi:MAG TPA: branched-chain amino acid ABC transporter permease [Acidimicrobiales bacterium]|nr:branched-chain amino acid ABC transporter permease [Acidimicrobiales bacterium]